ncbi:MAG: alpha/beta hydrolase [Chloroflexi bacterium]|nr:alpha/beta hydrolase [Chloroflexota bacterium]
MKNRHLWLLGVLLLIISVGMGAVLQASPAFAAKTYPIEARYSVAGPWAVSTGGYTDASGNTYDLFYPTHLGANGFKHPILTWGNGTDAVPSQYTGVLNQVASWGFVIIASTSKQTGTGNEMLAGAQDMVGLNKNSSGIFYNKLNIDEVGALGHSQGAGGSVRATVNSGGLIKTDVPICLPAQIFVSKPDAFDPSQLTVPTLFLGGSKDLLIASPLTLLGYYNKVPGAAALLVLNGADHVTIQGQGGRFLGYLTAWLMYQLQGDQYARGAFVGNPPESNTNTNWSWQAEKNLS